MSLPALVYYEGAAGGDSGLDPDRQQGTTQDAPSAFATALRAANADWTGEVPDAVSGEPLEFEMTGPDGQTATVTIEARENTADPTDGLITHFVIEYD
jgi:hypothetical protein